MGTSRVLVVLVASGLVAPSAAAETAKAAMTVSVTVVRPCTVSTDAPAVSVDCGRRQTQVRVTERPPQAEPSHSQDRPGSRTVTIDF